MIHVKRCTPIPALLFTVSIKYTLFFIPHSHFSWAWIVFMILWHQTPSLALLQCISTILMLCTSDMYTLINYVGFINYLFYGVTVAGQIVLRFKQPDMYRPIKVSPKNNWKPLLTKTNHFTKFLLSDFNSWWLFTDVLPSVSIRYSIQQMYWYCYNLCIVLWLSSSSYIRPI